MGAVANDLAAAVPDEVKESARTASCAPAGDFPAPSQGQGRAPEQVIIDEVGATVAEAAANGDAPDIDGSSTLPARPSSARSTVRIERADEI